LFILHSAFETMLSAAVAGAVGFLLFCQRAADYCSAIGATSPVLGR
jgi:hypothetical protein